jgi:hypothetical protein
MNLPGIRPRHLDLLRAALGKGERARQAWRAWLAEVDIRHLDHGTTALLPLLCWNAIAQGAEETEIPPRLQGVCRHAWVRNQVLLRSVAPVFRVFREQALEFMVVHGAALLLAQYTDLRRRPLRDVDVMIRPGALRHAEKLLLGLGWRHCGPDMDNTRPYLLAESNRLILREHALLEVADHGMEETAWRNPQQTPMGELIVPVPDATSMLFHVLIYGLSPPFPPPIRWAADAAVLLRKSGEDVDWAGLGQRAEQAGVAPHVAAALGFLRSFDPTLCPPDEQSARQRKGRIEFFLSMRLQKWAGPIPRWWFHARRMKMPFVEYMMQVFGMSNSWRLVRLLAPKAWTRWLRVTGLRYE